MCSNSVHPNKTGLEVQFPPFWQGLLGKKHNYILVSTPYLCSLIFIPSTSILPSSPIPHLAGHHSLIDLEDLQPICHLINAACWATAQPPFSCQVWWKYSGVPPQELVGFELRTTKICGSQFRIWSNWFLTIVCQLSDVWSREILILNPPAMENMSFS